MRDIPTSPRIVELKHKTRKKFWRLFTLFFILIVSIIVGLSYFSNSKKLSIDNIIIDGTNIIDSRNVDSFVKERLSGRYIYLFSRGNSLIYPKDEIYQNLLVEFPRIEELNIYREGFKTLRIKIKERSGSYLYCGEELPEDQNSIGEGCYFVNNDGYVFDNAPYFSGDVYFKYYVSIGDNISKPLGINIMDKDRFHELVRFVDGVEVLGFKQSYIVIDGSGVNSLYLAKRGNTMNPKIIFKTNDDLTIMLENLSSAMSKSEFANEIKERYDTLSYIDLRFDNKVIYKFQ